MPKPSSGPTIVLSLLVTMLCLSIGAIALIILFNANRPDSAAIAAACKSEVGAAIKTEADRVAEACEATPASTTSVFAATTQHPGFSYPTIWNVVGRVHEGGSQNIVGHTTYISDSAIDFSCQDCDGPLVPMTMTAFSPKEEVTDIAATIEKLKKNLPPDGTYTNATITTATLGGFPAYVLKAHASGLIEGDVEIIYIETATSYVIVNYIVTGNEAMATGWAQILVSLTF